MNVILPDRHFGRLGAYFSDVIVAQHVIDLFRLELHFYLPLHFKDLSSAVTDLNFLWVDFIFESSHNF